MPQCVLCSKTSLNSFFDVPVFKDHLINFHNLGSNDIYTCFSCEKKFQNRKSFFKHISKSISCGAGNIVETQRQNAEYNELNDKDIEQNSNIELNCDVLETHSTSHFTVANINSIHVCGQCGVEDSQLVEKNALQIACDLYGNFSLSRKMATDTIVNFSDNLINPILSILQTSILSKLETNDKIPMLNLLHNLKDPFRKFKSFHLFQKYLLEHNLYQNPTIFEINNEIKPVFINNTATLDESKTYGALMPLEFQFKQFFELPGVLDAVLSNISNLKNIEHKITSVLHSEIWKKRSQKFENKIVIPYILYFDEFQVDNCIGSHANEHSISAVYYYFPVLPKEFLSKLENIFVALLFESKNKYYGYGRIFQPLIDAINKLAQEGISVEYNGSQVTLYFVVLTITGDNAGLNAILGFVQSFIGNFSCRTCKISRDDLRQAVRENPILLRNRTNYAEDIASEPNDEKRVSLNGIKEDSIFNEINDYHVTENFAHDIMHDIFEGVCGYTISKVLLKFIDDEFLTISLLNARKDGFDYDLSESGNFSKSITMNNLQNSKFNMSAREMWTFVHFLPLMIGDKIPRGNKYWKLICLLIEIIDIVFSQYFDETILKTLSIKIESHHKLYLKLFGPELKLKPKFHYFLHYETMIRNIGPAKFYWCFRFESKHRQLKEYCKNVNSRINVAKSLAIKCCLNFSKRIITHSGFHDTISNFKLVFEDVLENKYYFQNLFLDSNLKNKKFKFYSDIEYCGMQYKQNLFLTKSANNFTNIYEIIDMVSDEQEIYIIGLNYLPIKFENHYQSFLINNSTDNYYFINLTEFDGPPTSLHKINQNKYLRKKMF